MGKLTDTNCTRAGLWVANVSEQLHYFSSHPSCLHRHRDSNTPKIRVPHYNGVTMSAMASQITSFTIVNSTVYSGTDQRKHQRSASLAFVRRILWSPMNHPHKGPVTRKIFPFDDVIIWFWTSCGYISGHMASQSRELCGLLSGREVNDMVTGEWGCCKAGQGPFTNRE